MSKLLSQAKISSYFVIYFVIGSCERIMFFSRGDHVKIVKGIPSILAVLEEPRWCFKHVLSMWACKLWEDMGGQKPEVEHLKMSGDGMEMSGNNGYLLLPCWSYHLKFWERREQIRKSAMVRLPSISAAVLEKDFSKVVFSIQLNSNAYNQGLIARKPWMNPLKSFGSVRPWSCVEGTCIHAEHLG